MVWLVVVYLSKQLQLSFRFFFVLSKTKISNLNHIIISVDHLLPIVKSGHLPCTIKLTYHEMLKLSQISSSLFLKHVHPLLQRPNPRSKRQSSPCDWR